ncbi:MAG: hypothetical protein V1734_00810 [Nanoarchaeota archaeon]
MKPRRVKQDEFKDRIDGLVVFDIPGKKFAYKGILERIAVDDTYVPKLHIHEKSNWLLIGVRPWFDRYTLYYGNYMRTEKEARDFLFDIQKKIMKDVPVEEIVSNGFQDALRYWE